jgi:hypothetical protein
MEFELHVWQLVGQIEQVIPLRNVPVLQVQELFERVKPALHE